MAAVAALALASGSVAGVVGDWVYAPTIGWTVGASAYVAWVWFTVAHLDAEQTASHATREDPGRRVTDLVLLGASVVSLVAVALLLVRAPSQTDIVQAALAGLGVLSVAVSWLLVHTLFMLRYARLYYQEGGGVSFNSSAPPRYSDFAYLAFTLGMTYQVSDTDISSASIRSTALRQGLLSYLFGSVVLATVVNLVVGLGSGSG